MQDPYAGVFVEQMLGELCRGIGIVESRRGRQEVREVDEHRLDGNAVASTLGAQDIRRSRRADLGLTWGRRGQD
jgi:hypothetical protein